MKGVILAGGKGTRLGLSTRVTNKHLLPVYNKPMILYPLQTLKDMGITEILLITGGNHMGNFIDFLGDGSEYGVKLTYKIQKDAGGIAQALALARDFVGEQFVVILGDNIFASPPALPPEGYCGLVLSKVSNASRFGVYDSGVIVEKPENPTSNEAVTGLYIYTKAIFNFIDTLQPSSRGEMEITDVNNWCLRNQPISIQVYDGFWSDAGTPESLLLASTWIHDNGK